MIFLSALGDVADKVAGLQLGAVDYVTKPIQPDEVLARVANHLTRQHLERELRASRDRLDRELESAGRMQRLILPPSLPSHPGVRVRRQLPDQPPRRRRLLRRARRSGAGPLRADGGRRVGPRRARGDRDGDDPRRAALASRHPRRSGGGAADAERALRIPLGHVDVRHRHLRGGGRRAPRAALGLRRSPAAAAGARRRRGARAGGRRRDPAAADAARPHPDRPRDARAGRPRRLLHRRHHRASRRTGAHVRARSGSWRLLDRSGGVAARRWWSA